MSLINKTEKYELLSERLTIVADLNSKKSEIN